MKQTSTHTLLERHYEPGLWSMEALTLIYMLITTAMTLHYWRGLDNPTAMILTRAAMLAIMSATYGLYRLHPCRALRILRVVPVMLGLVVWYPETYDFCSQLPYLDHHFAQIDQTLFGCQPALEFRQHLKSNLWSEAFNMGYYAYYYMMGATLLFYLLRRYRQADNAGFIFLGSFFLFYLIFDFLPVAGPQYYFRAVGLEAAQTGIFPAVGHYFRTHTEMLTTEPGGIFSQLVQAAQEAGERPTAAFPSSHVGMSTITMMLAWKARNKWLFWLMTPLYALLCCATVYIQAHYLIDSICGLLAAIAFYWLTNQIYTKLPNRQNPKPNPAP